VRVNVVIPALGRKCQECEEYAGLGGRMGTLEYEDHPFHCWIPV